MAPWLCVGWLQASRPVDPGHAPVIETSMHARTMSYYACLINPSGLSAGKPIDQNAIREIRADVLEGAGKEGADPGPQSQVIIFYLRV
jgi:hypothetical protein